MSEGFSIPPEVTSQLTQIFPESQNRRIIAGQLMLWDRKPNTKEQQEIGDGVGVSRTTVNHVLNKLSEHGLFTKELGSIPLYKASSRINLENSMELPEAQPVSALPIRTPDEVVPKHSLDIPESQGEQPMQPVEPVEERPMQASQASRADLERRMEGFSGTLKTIEARNDAQFLEVKEMINRLSFNPPSENPKDNPKPSPVVEPQSNNPSTLEDRIVELEKLQSTEGSTDPLENLSLEQIKELVRSQPQELVAMVTPSAGNPGGRVSATEVTLRPIIVMFTTYSQILFEKAVHDGYFDGTLSDFVNFSIEQYFKDRGYRLQFTRDDQTRRRFG